MLRRLRSIVVAAGACGLLWLGSPAAFAQTQSFPAKPVKLVIAFAAGGPSDVLGRMISDRLRQTWGQSVVPENRAGAAGNIAAEYVAKSPPHGYTLLPNASSHVVNESLYKLPYDPVKDFSPIAEVGGYHYVLAVRPSLGVRTLAEFIALAKARSGQLTMANAGAFTAADLGGRLFMQAAGIQMTNVSYKGAGPAVADIVGDHVDAMFTAPSQVMPLVKAGKLLALAITGPTRFAGLPEVPTVAESGFPGFVASTWFGVFGPAAMPPDLVERLNRDVTAVMRTPEVKDELSRMGWYASASSVEQFATTLRQDRSMWSRVIRDAGIRIEKQVDDKGTAMSSNASSTTFIAGRRRQLGYVDRVTTEADAPKLLLRNLALLDPVAGTVSTGFEVLLAAGRIVDVAKGTIDDREATVIDLGGRTLMPGLVDLHMHILGETLPMAPSMLPSLLTARATHVMLGMLSRGFTTVRDAGGADRGHKRAVEMGYMTGPRLFVSGRVISQTGGHGDSRSAADQRDPPLCCVTFPGIGRIADGVDEVRKAVRDELRLGADQIKVMAGGGIASQSDPIDQLQYSMEELQALVDECRRSHTYAMAHVYTSAGVQRCVSAGVRTIEHGNLIDEKTAKQMAEAGAYLVPTLAVFQTIKDSGRQLNFSEASMAKVEEILSVGTRSIELAQAAGVKIGFGTDVARAPDQQSTEFLLRAQVQKPVDIIRSATTVAAEVLGQVGKVGVIRPGAFADLVAVDGNPLEDIGLLSGQGDHLPLIIAAGRVFKNSFSDL